MSGHVTYVDHRLFDCRISGLKIWNSFLTMCYSQKWLMYDWILSMDIHFLTMFSHVSPNVGSDAMIPPCTGTPVVACVRTHAVVFQMLKNHLDRLSNLHLDWSAFLHVTLQQEGRNVFTVPQSTPSTIPAGLWPWAFFRLATAVKASDPINQVRNGKSDLKVNGSLVSSQQSQLFKLWVWGFCVRVIHIRSLLPCSCNAVGSKRIRLGPQ